MRCLFCGLFSSYRRVAKDRGQRQDFGVQGDSERTIPADTVRKMYRMPARSSADVGDSVSSRSSDAQGQLFRDSDL